MATQKVIPNLTESEANDTIQLYEDDGCTVSKEKQGDGTYTVTAICPDPQEEG